jgi:hypothetical protein
LLRETIPDGNDALIALAVICRLRFGAFAEACATNPDGLKLISDMVSTNPNGYCSKDADAKIFLIQKGCPEFVQFWNDLDTRDFIQRLKWDSLVNLANTNAFEIRLVFSLRLN